MVLLTPKLTIHTHELVKDRAIFGPFPLRERLLYLVRNDHRIERIPFDFYGCLHCLMMKSGGDKPLVQEKEGRTSCILYFVALWYY